MDVSNLSETQKVLLAEFRKDVKDYQMNDSSDAFLLKWLIARNFDIHQAKKMLCSSLEWRKNNEVDSILENWHPPEVLLKYFPASLVGRDKFGCPCVAILNFNKYLMNN